MEKIEFFGEIGFSDYESKVLSSLLDLQKATAKEISLNSGVPQNKLYQILKRFEFLGLLAILPEKSKRYELINFETFVSSKLKEKEKNLKLLKENSKLLRAEARRVIK